MAQANLQTLLESPELHCEACKGSKITVREAFTALSGQHYPRKESPCLWCNGVGSFSRPDVPELWQQIKGRKPGTIKSKRPDDARPYYLWRMIRFHTGKDVTLPMTASLEVNGDPYADLLSAMAEAISERLTGHQSAGRARWHAALYGADPQEPYLPESARSGGPIVTDCDKPLSELAELL